MSHKQERFEKYLDMYEKMVLKNVIGYVGYHAAQDIAQETFLKMFLYLDYLCDEKVKPWLLVVSVNIAKNYLKKMEDTETLMAVATKSALNDEIHVESVEDYSVTKEAAHELLRTAFELLYEKNPVWYDVMLDSYILEMSSKEISVMLNLTVANVDVIKLRARKYLSKMLGNRYRELF